MDEHVTVGAGAVLENYVHVGAGTRIEAGAVIGEGVRIGEHCRIYPRAVIYPGTTLGNRVVVHAGAVLGADGFGYVRDPATGAYTQFPQQGTLVIEDDVEIGANSTIDRGALAETRIRRGAKIDNLVHVGHNCDIGEDVILVSLTGISGSSHHRQRRGACRPGGHRRPRARGRRRHSRRPVRRLQRKDRDQRRPEAGHGSLRHARAPLEAGAARASSAGQAGGEKAGKRNEGVGTKDKSRVTGYGYRLWATSYGLPATDPPTFSRLLLRKRLRLERAIALLDQHLHLALGRVEFLLAGGGKTHAFFEQLQRLFEGQIALFQLVDDRFRASSAILQTTAWTDSVPATKCAVRSIYFLRSHCTLRQHAGNHFGSHVVAAERRAYLHAVHIGPNRLQHLLRNLDALARAASGVSACAMRSMISSGIETRRSFFRNSALRRLVSGQMPAITGNAEVLDSLQEILEQAQIEDRLRDGVLRAGLHLEGEAPQLVFHVAAAGLAATPMVKLVLAPMEFEPMSSP